MRTSREQKARVNRDKTSDDTVEDHERCDSEFDDVERVEDERMQSERDARLRAVGGAHETDDYELSMRRRSSDSDEERRPNGIVGSAMKLFKSLRRSEREAKRPRDGSDTETEAGQKRLRSQSGSKDESAATPRSTVGGIGGASFITSSVQRKSTVRRTGNGGAQGAETVAPTNLSSRFGDNVDDDDSVELAEDVLASPKNVKIKRSGSRKLLDTIFSPMFSFFSSSGGRRKQNRRSKSKKSKQTDDDQFEIEPDGAIPNLSMSSIHNAMRSMGDLDGKQVELYGGEQLSAREYLDRFGMTSDEAASVPYEDYDEEYDPWAFIYNLKFSSPCAVANGPRGPVLPARAKDDNRNTLVLDLDETLVHSNLENTGGKSDFSFPVVFNGEIHQVNVRTRPHLQTFMETVSKKYEIVVFTASQQIYADKLLDLLDPKREWIAHRVFRDSCVQIEGNYMKDLRVLGRDLSKTIIIDNSPQAFGLQVENGIPIESWYDDDKDNHLLFLLPILDELASETDVRSTLSRMFNLGERVRRGGLRSDAWRTALGMRIGTPLP